MYLRILLLLLLSVFFILPVNAQEIELYSVTTNATEAKRGDVFETRLEVSEENPDVSTNLVINGTEYFGNEGGGACRSDGQMFGGWLTPENSSVNRPTARVMCTIPYDTPENATIELIGFQFRNCEGPTQADGSVRCKIVKAAKSIKLIEDETKDDDEDSEESSVKEDSSKEIENRILDDILQNLFGGLSGENEPGNKDDSSDTDEESTDTGDPQDDDSGSSSVPVSGEAKSLANCIAEKHGSYIENYKTHLPYILTYAQKRNISIPQTAYIIATGRHETGDYHYKEEIADGTQYNGRVKGLCNVIENDGPRFKGRGYVQLTGRCNYTKYTPVELRKEDPHYNANRSKLDPVLQEYANKDYSSAFSKKVNLLANPTYIVDDLNGAGAVIVNGMMDGNFTGAKLTTFVDGSKKDYYNARTVVNGYDKASTFAASAVRFEGFLRECSK